MHAVEAGYRQGRASIEHPQLPPELEHETRLPMALPQLAQSLPYSKSVKLRQELMAALWALARDRSPELSP